MSHPPGVDRRRFLLTLLAGLVAGLCMTEATGARKVHRIGVFALIVNLKTAKTLGLTIPHSLLLRADQIIDP